MICQNCQATVDNDLVFCTNCGMRLNETWSKNPTVSANDSAATKLSVPPVPKSNSNFKWMALIVALVAVPVSLFAAYLIFNNSKQNQIVANQTKPTNSSSTPSTNRQNTNNTTSNNPVNTVNTASTNVNTTNIIVNTNSNLIATEALDEDWLNEKATADKRTEIWNERISIAPENHYAMPFSVDGNDKIIGIIKTLQGSSVQGYVFTQSAFDDHFPEETFKTFSFGGEKDTKIEQTLVKGKYVIVFMNKTKAPILIYGKIFTVRQ